MDVFIVIIKGLTAHILNANINNRILCHRHLSTI